MSDLRARLGVRADHGRRDDRDSRREHREREPDLEDKRRGARHDDAAAIDDDPRRGRKPAPSRKGRNTESFDPASTLARPDLRLRVGQPSGRYAHPLRHDDLIIVPGFFCAEDDWSTYHALIAETRAAHAALAARGQRGEQSDWMAWHEVRPARAHTAGSRRQRSHSPAACPPAPCCATQGCHLISRAVAECPTFQKVLRAMAAYFGVQPSAKATRFNWYKDSSDWKPLHHDSAAFNPERARTQNLTIGISFGAERELAFLNARNGARVSLPCPNGSLYAFGRDVNVRAQRGLDAPPHPLPAPPRLPALGTHAALPDCLPAQINWKHGVNALPPSEHGGPGRVSIILWGDAKQAIEEAGSPPLIVNSHGPTPHGPPPRGGEGHHGGFRR